MTLEPIAGEDRSMFPHRSLGQSALTVSTIGLGCNNFGRTGTATESQEGTAILLAAAIDSGITFFDTADIYGATPGQSESFMGNALKGKRSELVLATKFGHQDIDMGIAPGHAKGSRAYIRAALDDSLRRLQTDVIDLYQMHTPDPETDIEETIVALDELVSEGKIRYFGHSQFTAAQILEADAAATRLGTRVFVSAQDEYNLLARGVEQDVLPAVARAGLGFLPFFPLHNGLLTGKFTRSERPQDSRIMRQRPHLAEDAPWDVIDAYAQFCAARGVTMLEATFTWLLATPELSSVIAGATTPTQVRQNAAAATSWSATPDDIAQISLIFA
jgi:aryl-alcohol dehydrogenase-like predicted oxidoreductase